MYHSMDITTRQGRYTMGWWPGGPVVTNNTYRNFHIVPTSKPIINPPEVSTEYAEVLDRDGLLDLTGKITGYAPFKNREGSWEFIVVPPYDFYETYGEVMKYLHGSFCDIILLDDDPNYKYSGRLMVSDPKAEDHWNYFSINYNLNPFKEHLTTGELRL